MKVCVCGGGSICEGVCGEGVYMSICVWGVSVCEGVCVGGGGSVCEGVSVCVCVCGGGGRGGV